MGGKWGIWRGICTPPSPGGIAKGEIERPATSAGAGSALPPLWFASMGSFLMGLGPLKTPLWVFGRKGTTAGPAPHRTRLSPVGVGTALVLLVTAACRPPEDGGQTEIPVVGSVDAAEACPRSPAQTRTPLLKLNQTSGYRCRVVAVPTGVELRPSPDGARPDPKPSGGQLGDQVAVDSRGRIYTGARWQS